MRSGSALQSEFTGGYLTLIRKPSETAAGSSGLHGKGAYWQKIKASMAASSASIRVRRTDHTRKRPYSCSDMDG